MSKTYFCELVSGFFLNLDQTTVVISMDALDQ